jgi:hypothetical protein
MCMADGPVLMNTGLRSDKIEAFLALFEDSRPVKTCKRFTTYSTISGYASILPKAQYNVREGCFFLAAYSNCLF